MRYETLPIKEWMCNTLVDLDEGLRMVDVRTYIQYHLETMAYMLSVKLRVPTKAIQEDRVIAEYPTGLWDYILRALGFENYRRTEVRLSEHWAFPDIAIPTFSKDVRIILDPRVVTYRPGDDYD